MINKKNNDLVVVLVAIYRFQNFAVRAMHSLLENVEGIKPYTIFFKNYETNTFNPTTKKEEDLFVNQIKSLNPDLVGFSVLSPYVPVSKRLTSLVKDNSTASVIWGGIHPTISPESSIKETDMICVGEGEGAIVELVECIRDKKDYRDVKNLWINTKDRVLKNPMRPLIQDLDSVPFPAYGRDSFSFIDSNRLIKDDPSFNDDNNIWVQSSRGCPFICSYCVNSMLRPLFKDLGAYTRRRSVDSVIEEIKTNVDMFGNRKDYVLFVDEVFGTDKAWLDEFESKYSKEVGLPFYVEYNPKYINPDILGQLVKAGAHTINFGIQTGSDYIRNKVFQRPGKNKEIIKAAHEIAKHRIRIKCDFIINNPYDTVETLKEAVDLLLQLPKPLAFNLFTLQYFPDYPLTLKAIKDGHITEQDASADTLMERTTRTWAFVPKLKPLTKKNMMQNIVWLIVWGHVKDDAVRFAVFNDSFRARVYFVYLNIKSVILGRIVGVGGLLWKHVWLSCLINGIKYIFKGDFKLLFAKIQKHINKLSRKYAA